MYLGNLLLLVINLPLIKLWVKIIRIPYSILAGMILLTSTAACYASNGNIFDMYVMFGFGLFAWIVSKLGYSVAPILLGLILGPLLEYNVRNALILSNGSYSVFLTQPVSLVLFLYSALTLIVPQVRRVLRKNNQ